jgi:hypothetical protein
VENMRADSLEEIKKIIQNNQKFLRTPENEIILQLCVKSHLNFVFYSNSIRAQLKRHGRMCGGNFTFENFTFKTNVQLRFLIREMLTQLTDPESPEYFLLQKNATAFVEQFVHRCDQIYEHLLTSTNFLQICGFCCVIVSIIFIVLKKIPKFKNEKKFFAFSCQYFFITERQIQDTVAAICRNQKK